MILTDSHTHIYYQTDQEDLSAQMRRCFANDVYRLFLPNVDSASIPLVLNLANQYPQNCFPMLGLHPCDVKSNYLEELALISDALKLHKVYAIGEIGIDLYWDKSLLGLQQDAFKSQIEWAKKMGLPIVIHCREAFDEVFEILEEQKDNLLRGIFHCFTGNAAQATKVIELGFLLGIGGVLTYKNAGLAEVVAGIDLEHIVLETDAPYLPPVPFRGKPNESSYLIYVAQKLAEIKNVTVDEIATITTANSIKVFGV